MMPSFLIIFLFIGAGLLFWLELNKKEKLRNRLNEMNCKIRTEFERDMKNAVDYKALSNPKWHQRVLDFLKKELRLLGKKPLIKIIVYYSVLFVFCIEFNRRFVREDLLIVFLVFAVISSYLILSWLKKRKIAAFDDGFPDALNLLFSAVSAGESIAHAIVFVGKTLDSQVGREFKWMGERLQMGEPTDAVLTKSCQHYPYPTFVFFIITIRANIERGGQLKEVLKNLNRVMFEARAAGKKKMALTSEARASAKIVGAIPFLFLIFMQVMTPENYEFVMFSQEGRPILYYMLGSEFLGFLIIRYIMSGV